MLSEPGEQLAPVVDNQMQLEAKEPAFASSTSGSAALDYLVLPDPEIAAYHQARAVNELDAGSGGSANASVMVTVTASTTTFGDCDNDGHVSITDLSILLSYYGQAYAACDFNSDSIVNILDLSTLLNHYGT